MHVAYGAVLLSLLTAGCASVTLDTPVSQPQIVATQPATPQSAAAPHPAATPQPVATPVAPAPPHPAPAAVPVPSGMVAAPQAASKVAPPVARAPAPIAKAPTSAALPAPVASPAPAEPLALDLDALKERLRATKAIGLFTKISLKNKVDDLLQQFREHYQGKVPPTMTELRGSYNLLMMKVLSLLQDSDQTLASEVVSSREAIWGLLSDPKKFATLES